MDAGCWDRLRETHPISLRMPSLPVVHLSKDRKKARPVTPIKVRVAEIDYDEPEMNQITKLTTPPKEKQALTSASGRALKRGSRGSQLTFTYLHPSMN